MKASGCCGNGLKWLIKDKRIKKKRSTKLKYKLIVLKKNKGKY